MDSVFLVERDDYKSFVERLKKEKMRIEDIQEREFSIVKIFSQSSGKCLCSRKTYNEGAHPEEYYIFEYPEQDEWGPPIPKRKLVLETKEEVQAFFDALSKLQKEKKNG